MTDQEINIALAKAIGWTEKDIDRTYIFPSGKIFCNHCVFDYRDPAVIWPIAAHFRCFPFFRLGHGNWVSYHANNLSVAGAPEKAVALAVIGVAA